MVSCKRSLRCSRSLTLGALSTLVACLSGCEGADEHPLARNTAGASGTADPSVVGAAQQGGSASGGTAAGGAATGGAAQQGGSATGGTAAGGAATGGAAQQGGSATGGTAAGGAATGGAAQQGGSAAGGKAAGGAATGGKAAAGGRATGGASSGGSSGSSSVANQYVDATNAVRAAVAQPPNYTGTWVALPNVTWSDAVAASAQAWANSLAANNNCGLEHESQSTYGENLAMGTNLTPQKAVDMWAGEKSKYTWSATYSMADFNAGSGHYTQLVWRASIQIGCGSATCGNVVVISCRYSPPGNYIGKAVY